MASGIEATTRADVRVYAIGMTPLIRVDSKSMAVNGALTRGKRARIFNLSRTRVRRAESQSLALSGSNFITAIRAFAGKFGEMLPD